MMMREMIMDHYENPRNKGDVSDPRYLSKRMNSTSCIDDITIQLLLEDDIVKDVKWHGTACAISTAATSIMTELVIGKPMSDVGVLMDNYMKMLQGEEYDEEVLGEAIVFQNTGRQPSRIGCATIGWRGLLQASGEEDKTKED